MMVIMGNENKPMVVDGLGEWGEGCGMMVMVTPEQVMNMVNGE